MILIKKLIQKLNKLESTLNTFMTVTFNTHTHICATPSSPSATPVPPSTAFIIETQQVEIEDTKVKH